MSLELAEVIAYESRSLVELIPVKFEYTSSRDDLLRPLHARDFSLGFDNPIYGNTTHPIILSFILQQYVGDVYILANKSDVNVISLNMATSSNESCIFKSIGFPEDNFFQWIIFSCEQKMKDFIVDIASSGKVKSLNLRLTRS